MAGRNGVTLDVAIHLFLERCPRPMADVEICANIGTNGRAGRHGGYAGVRTELGRLATAGRLECERRETATAHGRIQINTYYRLAGSSLPWPGTPPAAFVPPDPAGFPGLPPDAERVLAAAELVADAAGLLNAGPLREAAGLSVVRVRAAVATLRSLGGWPYRWRVNHVMPEGELLARIAVASGLKRRVVVERGPTGEAIADCEFDLAYGEECRA